MKVVVKKSAVRQIIQEFLDAGKEKSTGDKSAPRVINEPPVQPDETMDVQPLKKAKEKPSLGGDPLSSEDELVQSLISVLSQVPEDESDKVKRQVKRVARNARKRARQKNQNESHLRAAIRKILIEVGPGMIPQPGDPEWRPGARWGDEPMGSQHRWKDKKKDEDEWGAPSHEEIMAAEQDPEALEALGSYTPGSEDLSDLDDPGAAEGDSGEARGNIEDLPPGHEYDLNPVEEATGVALANHVSAELGAEKLTPDIVRRMNLGDLIKLIAQEIGTGLNNVRNIIYDDLKLLGDLPPPGKKLPIVYDMEKFGTAHNIEAVTFTIFRDLVIGINPAVEEVLPDGGKTGLSDLKVGKGPDHSAYLAAFKLFAQGLYKEMYDKEIKDARHLQAKWHTFASPKKHGKRVKRPHSTNNPIQGLILQDVIDQYHLIPDQVVAKILKGAFGNKLDKLYAKQGRGAKNA